MSGTISTTTTGAEIVYTAEPAAVATSAGVEVWGEFAPVVNVTQLGVEVCFTNEPQPRRRPVVVISG